jgi:NAD(P)-dependent dehydrogenase (short-subunit alcohol dehydrogenase family)
MEAERRIVITGASRGLGRALAEGFAALGHTVYGCGRSREELGELSGKLGAPHRFEVVDVTSDDQVSAWAKEVLAAGPPDLLINNAAIMNHPAPLWEVPLSEFERMVAINITGVFVVLRHFVPAMVERGEGVIVNLSSGWGRSTSPKVAPYCATKYAIEGLTKSLAQELPAGMAAVPLNPGIINTEMLRSAWGDGASAYPTPEKWAKRAIPYLLQLSGANNGESATVPMR